MAIQQARHTWFLLSTTTEVQENPESVQPTPERLTQVALPGGLQGPSL